MAIAPVGRVSILPRLSAREAYPQAQQLPSQGSMWGEALGKGLGGLLEGLARHKSEQMQRQQLGETLERLGYDPYAANLPSNLMQDYMRAQYRQPQAAQAQAPPIGPDMLQNLIPGASPEQLASLSQLTASNPQMAQQIIKSLATKGPQALEAPEETNIADYYAQKYDDKLASEDVVTPTETAMDVQADFAPGSLVPEEETIQEEEVVGPEQMQPPEMPTPPREGEAQEAGGKPKEIRDAEAYIARKKPSDKVAQDILRRAEAESKAIAEGKEAEAKRQREAINKIKEDNNAQNNFANYYKNDLDTAKQTILKGDERLKDLLRLNQLNEEGDLASSWTSKLAERYPQFADYLLSADSQEAQKIVASMIRGVSAEIKGNLSNMELMAWMKQNPDLINSPEGRKRVIHALIIKNLSERAHASAFQDEFYKEMEKPFGKRKDYNIPQRAQQQLEKVNKFLRLQTQAGTTYLRKNGQPIPDGFELKSKRIPGQRVKKLGFLWVPGKKVKGEWVSSDVGFDPNILNIQELAEQPVAYD